MHPIFTILVGSVSDVMNIPKLKRFAKPEAATWPKRGDHMACYVVTKWSPRGSGRTPGQAPRGSGRTPLQGRRNPWLRGTKVSRQGCLGTKWPSAARRRRSGREAFLWVYQMTPT